MAKRNMTQRDQALDIIVKEAMRLKQLANDLLDVSRIESGVLLYERRKVLAAELVKEIVEEARLSANCRTDDKETGVMINESIQHNDGLAIEVDRSKIIQALSNILNNSIKFTKHGQVNVTSRVNQQNQFEISISDSGPGIPQDLLPKLFEKFATMSPDGNSRKDHGTGLGLFICKSIVMAHGGSVTAANNGAVRGATFVVTLPIS
jgi:signal transduction histidine kinase